MMPRVAVMLAMTVNIALQVNNQRLDAFCEVVHDGLLGGHKLKFLAVEASTPDTAIIFGLSTTSVRLP